MLDGSNRLCLLDLEEKRGVSKEMSVWYALIPNDTNPRDPRCWRGLITKLGI